MRSLPLAAPSWLRSADEPLKLVLRTLNTVPAARLTFFTYVILLHAWVLFILQQMALHPSSS
ncbi:ychF [Symbiodinium sp. CCMP2456]|nr:ychF [Symbiodinium sp. CCMP2456]